MILNFNRQAVAVLLRHAKTALEHSPTFSQLYDAEYRKAGKVPDMMSDPSPTSSDMKPGAVPPGLQLVGDQGVYLMSNGIPNMMADGSVAGPHAVGSRKVVYANEVNPDKLDFDIWWERKRESFGGDDGVEFLRACHFEHAISAARDRGDDTIKLDVTPSTISIVY